MADLSAGGFQRVTSGSGSLALTYGATLADELHAWVLLVDPATLTPQALTAEVLLRELIRVPLDPGAGRATLYVPVGRPLGILVMARDAAGRLVEAPDFDVREGEPVARLRDRSAADADPPASGASPIAGAEETVTTVTTVTKAAALSPPPGPIRTSRQGREIPLVFAQAGRGPLPDLASLAQRVAARTGSPPIQPPTLPTPTPATPAARTATERPSAGFGARQRWTLTRLGFAPSERPRALVLRQTFIDEAALASFQAAPPADAVPLPPGVDGVVDALTEDDAMVFYALLEGPAPWLPVPLTPLSPPFSESVVPFVLGDAAARLEPYLSQPPRSETHATLLADVARALGSAKAPARPGDRP